MSFGRNPMVAKAQLAEQKASEARDETARSGAWRDAARFWDRAAEREVDGKRRDEYERNATRARARADGEPVDEESENESVQPRVAPSAGREVSKVSKGNLLN